MEFKTSGELARIAEIYPDAPRQIVLSRQERLERWAEVLRRSNRRLQTLHGTEYQRVSVRDRMRADDSALTVAFDDPRLKAEGLVGDSYGDAKRFFELSDDEMHRVVCDCHLGFSASSRMVARRVDEIAHPRPGMLRRMWSAVFA